MIDRAMNKLVVGVTVCYDFVGRAACALQSATTSLGLCPLDSAASPPVMAIKIPSKQALNLHLGMATLE